MLSTVDRFAAAGIRFYDRRIPVVNSIAVEFEEEEYFMSSLMLTLRESVRYRGRSGHWSLAILSVLVIHVWDTANAT